VTDVGILVAFLAGIVSFASPCCLPLVPVYVGYMVGTTPNGQSVARRAAFVQSLAFVAGFSFVFVTLWASVGLIGYFLRDYVWLMRQTGGAILVFMGLHVAGLISISALYREFRFKARPALAPAASGAADFVRPSLGRSTLLGVVFAAGWTPCVGPILGGIIGLASVSGSAAWGTVLLLSYALGLGIPFILVAMGATAVSGRLGWFRRHEAAVSLVTGSMLVLVGFLMITNLFVRVPSLLGPIGV
jgi:cytochrome c-type biogenesis protein